MRPPVNPTRLAYGALAVLAGSASGLVGAIAFARMVQPATQPIAPFQMSVPSTPQARLVQGNGVEAVSSCEAPAIARRDVAAEPEGRVDAAMRRPEDVQKYRESMMQLQLHEHELALESHRQEPRDSRWASEMEHTVDQGFRSLAVSGGTKAKASQIDCRSVSCTAKLTWDSHDTAARDLATVSDLARNGVGCGRRLVLPDPTPGSSEYSATLYIDCTQMRFGAQ
jgi:hypothetical protein